MSTFQAQNKRANDNLKKIQVELDKALAAFDTQKKDFSPSSRPEVGYTYAEMDENMPSGAWHVGGRGVRFWRLPSDSNVELLFWLKFGYDSEISQHYAIDCVKHGQITRGKLFDHEGNLYDSNFVVQQNILHGINSREPSELFLRFPCPHRP